MRIKPDFGCMFIILAFILLYAGKALAKPTTTQKYTNEIELLPNERLHLYWDYNQEEITFELHSKNDAPPPLSSEFVRNNPGVAVSNTSWIVLGIKSTSESPLADMIVSWVRPDGIGHFSDRHIRGTKLTVTNHAIRDAETNAFPLDAYNKDGYSVIKFKRSILTCPQVVGTATFQEDLSIPSGEVELIFGIGSLFKNHDYHLSGNRYEAVSSKAIQLINPTSPPSILPLRCNDVKSEAFGSEPMDVYTNQADLKEQAFRFYWNYTKAELIGEIHVKTRGWVGLGISPNGGMDQSDIMVAWISDSDGSTNFTDRFIVDRKLIIDKKQDWFLLASKQINDFTIIKFRRNIKLCDPDDRIIEEGAPYVIYAYGLSDPSQGQDVSYHLANRGTKSLNLISAVKTIAKDNGVEELETFDISITDVILPRDKTTYYAKVFAIPKEFKEKRHILKWELILPKYNFDRMHHLDTKECKPEYEAQVENAPGDVSYEYIKNQYCRVNALGWSIGGDLISVFPSNTGYPIGGDTDYQANLIELHYDNPNSDIGYVEKLTVRYFMTKYLRKHELGILALGTFSTSAAIFVPPGMKSFDIDANCFKSCTDRSISGDLTVIKAMPHTHLTGRSVYTKIIRDGQDIGYLHKIENFDFNYQQTYDLNPPMILKRGDELVTRCTYRTTSRNGYTFGGKSTEDEMCSNFFTYYPRNKNFKTCFSGFYPNDVVDLVEQLSRNGLADTQNVPQSSMNNLTLMMQYAIEGTNSLENHAHQQNETIKEYIRTFVKSKMRFSSFCKTEFEPGAIEAIKVNNVYIEPNACEND